MQMVQKTFLKACMEHFGKSHGQTLVDFRDEMAALTPKDKEDLIVDFRAIGVEIITAAKV